MNNVTIKFLKVVLDGSNLFQGMGWTAKALFAWDISCLKTQNCLLRNVCLPHKILPPPLGCWSHRGTVHCLQPYRKRRIILFFPPNKPKCLATPGTITLGVLWSLKTTADISAFLVTSQTINYCACVTRLSYSYTVFLHSRANLIWVPWRTGLLQHSNRVPLVVRSHLPHTVHRLQIEMRGKNSRGQDVRRWMIYYWFPVSVEASQLPQPACNRIGHLDKQNHI